MRDAGLALDETLVEHSDGNADGGYEAARRLLDHPHPPTAIFCGNDRVAMGAYDAIKERGLRIPEDISVVGFDGIELGSYIRPALTTVAIPTYELGAAALRRLLELIARKQEGAPGPDDHTTWLPTELVVRESSALVSGAAR